MLLSTNFPLVWFIAIGSASLMLILIFFFLLFVQSNKRKILHIKEKNELELNYETALMQSQLEIQEQTLTLISEEIHDNIGQTLSLARLHLNTLSGSHDQQKIEQTDELLGKAIGDLRVLSHNLNPQHLIHTGFSESINQMLTYLNKSGKYSTFFTDESGDTRLDDEKSIILLRMIQEIINNIVKHAGADKITVFLSHYGQRFSIQISDNGKGFNTEKIIGQSGGGLGISNILKRAKLIGANVQFVSAENKGTTVLMDVQLNQK